MNEILFFITLYSAFLERDLVDLIYLTEVNDDADGDTYFPNVLDNWYLFYQSYINNLCFYFLILKLYKILFRYIIYI